MIQNSDKSSTDRDDGEESEYDLIFNPDPSTIGIAMYFKGTTVNGINAEEKRGPIVSQVKEVR